MPENEKKEPQLVAEEVLDVEGAEAPVAALSREPFRMVALSSGREVKCVPVSPLLLQQVIKRYEVKPPIKTITPMGGVPETYADTEDKEYLRQLSEAGESQREASNNVLLLRGLPEVQPEDDWSWADELEFLFGEDIKREGAEGRLNYIKYRLLSNTYDLLLIIRTVSELSGATEKIIQQIMADFQ